MAEKNVWPVGRETFSLKHQRVWMCACMCYYIAAAIAVAATATIVATAASHAPPTPPPHSPSVHPAPPQLKLGENFDPLQWKAQVFGHGATQDLFSRQTFWWKVVHQRISESIMIVLTPLPLTARTCFKPAPPHPHPPSFAFFFFFLLPLSPWSVCAVIACKLKI